MSLDLGDLSKVIEMVGKDKGIDPGLLVSALEEAMLTVAKRKYGIKKDIEARYNEEIGEVELFQFQNVVDEVKDKDLEISIQEAQQHDPEAEVGDSLGVKLDTKHISRIAAQTAKQVIVQKVRDAEREIIFNEFQHRKGEVITGLVRRVDRGAVIVDLGKTEGYMPFKEQIPDEPYNSGDRIQAYLLDVQLTPKGPRIILSRACPEYLKILFDSEVPEIREGLVKIEGAARDPGVRAKIAVTSKDPDVDPIGACVGVRGSRVQNVVQELRGERIDIVPWDEDISRFVCNALAPAEIQKVIIDDDAHSIEVVVSDENLSLAIGKRGQNVRLASQLTGWKIDIVSETEMARRVAEARYQLNLIEALNETQIMALYQSGFEKVADVAQASADMLKDVPGFEDEAKTAEVIQSAQKVLESGAADVEMPAEQMDPALRKKLEMKEAQERQKTEAVEKMETLEAKLRAELAAHEKSKDKPKKS